MLKNGKLFGKVNLFDAAIIILVLILVIVGISKFKIFDSTVDSNSSGKIKYTVLINDVRDYTIKALQSGDIVYDTTTDINIGKITNIESRNAKTIKSLASGQAIVAENPYRKDIILTIETPGSNTNNGYFANKSIELKVGSEKKIETLYTMSMGKISSIEYVEGE